MYEGIHNSLYASKTTDTKVTDGEYLSAHEKDNDKKSKRQEQYNILKFTVFRKYKRIAIYTS